MGSSKGSFALLESSFLCEQNTDHLSGLYFLYIFSASVVSGMTKIAGNSPRTFIYIQEFVL